MLDTKVVLIGLVALLSGACCPDPRTAEIIVENPKLLAPVHRAAHEWNLATHGDVSFTFTTKCESDNCIHIKLDESTAVADSHFDSSPGTYAATTKIEPWVANQPFTYQVSVIAHELGHIIGLEHTDKLETDRAHGEVMTEHDFGNDEGHACIGLATCAQYIAVNSGSCAVTCW